MRHPPVATPLVGLAPFLAASIALAGAAMIVGPSGNPPLGQATTLCAVAAALVSFGPQKWYASSIALAGSSLGADWLRDTARAGYQKISLSPFWSLFWTRDLAES